MADGRAAYNFAVNGHRPNSDNVEVAIGAELGKQLKIAAPILSKRPLVPDAYFTQRFGILNQLLHKILWFGCGELCIERNNEKMPHSKPPDQSDLVFGGGKQMRRLLRPQHFLRMGIKRDYDWRSIFCPRMLGRSGYDRLMTEMDTVKDANGEKERPR